MSEYSSRDDFAIGEKSQLSRTVTEDDIWHMAEITGDFNPVHIDEGFASRTRFKGRIAHGVFSAGLISAVLGTKLPGPGAVYLQKTLDFLYPVRAGDTHRRGRSHRLAGRQAHHHTQDALLQWRRQGRGYW